MTSPAVPFPAALAPTALQQHAPGAHDDDLADVVAPGTVLAGKYEVVRLLGKGGMGTVLEARHLRLGQHVALKLLRSSVRTMAEVTTRFGREARAAGRLQGPHVARILDVDALPDGSPFMVMELLRGKELGEELEARGPLPVREAVGYVLQACAGMAEAHRAGIVHRDLKPSNLFLCDQDGRRIVKVLDFGISKLAGDVQASVTTTATAFGTPLYMSPEQVRSAKHVDARADVWALGVVLYELLAGESPFVRGSATAILAAIVVDKPPRLDERGRGIPSGLSKAVMKALEKDPNARYASVLDFAAAIAPYGPPRDDPSLAAISSELASPRAADGPAGAMTAFPGVVVPRRNRTLLLALAALALALTTLVLLAATWKSSDTPGPAQDSVVAASTAPATGSATAASATAAAPSSAPTPGPTTPAPVADPPKPTSKPAGAASGSSKSKVAVPTAAPSAPPPGPTSDPKYL